VTWRIAVYRRDSDPEGHALALDATEIGVRDVRRVETGRVYYIRGLPDEPAARRVADSLFVDRVTDRYLLTADSDGPLTGEIEVLSRPGVMEPSVASILRAVADMGYADCDVHVATTYRFDLESGRPLGRSEQALLVNNLLANPAIQRLAARGEPVFTAGGGRPARVRTIRLVDRPIEALERLSRQRMLSLSREEMLAIQRHYTVLGRDPTDAELETFAQTWSEHCQHKTFRGAIDMPGRRMRNLLKSTVFRVTAELDLPWCLSVFHDNSGVIEFDERHAVTFKVETHNHPSAIEPYGGAATGIGGVIRDCLGTGLGAKPILNTDVFCFAPLDTRTDEVPKGVMHPRRVMKGVVAGVRDYGNRMGIPTANGAVYFDPGYLGNPLVFCGTLGLIPRAAIRKRVRKGQDIVLLGGRTGRDGIHGVTFASVELHHESEDVGSGAVQIGNPIEEKKVADLMLVARDQGLFSAVTDCGGGGLSSAVGELASSTGCEVWLDRVPLKYAGLSPAEIWISESQERMLVFTEPGKTARLVGLAHRHDVDATVIGRTTGSKRLILRYRRKTVADIDMKFLHRGWRGVRRKAEWRKPETADPAVPLNLDLSEQVLRLLQCPNVASKEWVTRQYDHEVQAASATKPFCGPARVGPTDGCVVSPVPGSRRGCVVSCGLCPRYGLIDPYWMAASAIDEALRNCVAAGGDIERTALLDNFCWGSPERPDHLAGLVRAAEACYDVAKAFRVPFISGKDSLYNEFKTETGESLPIPPTLLVSAVSVIPDVGAAGPGSDLKATGNALYLLGETREELGGSEYFRINQGLGREVPKVEAARARRAMKALGRAMRAGLVRSCHDLSEGGLGVALAEMAIGGALGCRVQLRKVPGAERFRRDDFLLFSETNSRFLCEVRQLDRARFEAMMAQCTLAAIGRVEGSGMIEVVGLDGAVVVSLPVAEARAGWRRTLTRRLGG
jgi:phosphoribosylformylglycinamidine synthase